MATTLIYTSQYAAISLKASWSVHEPQSSLSRFGPSFDVMVG